MPTHGRVRPEDVIAWKDPLLEEDGPTGKRSPRTVRDTYRAALKAVFGWARETTALQSIRRRACAYGWAAPLGIATLA